jgi:hypothetical protein
VIKVLLILGFLFASLAVAEERVPMIEVSRVIPVDSFVYITREGKKYHREDCSYLKKSKLKVSMREAIENRYEPCKRCYPRDNDTTSLE